MLRAVQDGIAFAPFIEREMRRTVPSRQGPLGWRNNRGFTLIEAMIAVVIVALIAGLAAPNFVIWQAKSSLKQATVELTANLNVARRVAMNRNQRVLVRTMQVPPVTGQWQAQFLNADLTPALPPFTLPVDVTGVTFNPPAPGTLTFNSLGMLVGVGTVNQHIVATSNKLPAGANSLTVQVSPGGKVRWCTGSASMTC